MNVDPDGHDFIAFLIFLAVVSVSAFISGLDGGITASMNGQNFWKGFAAGAIGGTVHGILAFFAGPWGAIIGRGLNSAIYGITNELFQYGTLDNMDWGLFAADILFDVTFSLLYVGFIDGIASKILGTVANGIIETIIDVIESWLFYVLANKERKKVSNYSFS